MARKPNYRFDRMEKDRVKAAKKAERLKVKQERSSKRGQDEDANPSDAADTPAEQNQDNEDNKE